MTEIEIFIKKTFEPVKDKPGYVWFSKRNFQIISIETLTKCIEMMLGRENQTLKVMQEDE